MAQDDTFNAGEAALITGISTGTQLDWRRRGFLPGNGGRHARFGIGDLCRLRLLKAMVDAGLPVGAGVAHLADQFVDSLLSQLVAAEAPGQYDPMVAVIARAGDEYRYSVVFSLAEFDFDSATILNLHRIADAMHTAIRDVRVSRD